MNSEKTGSDAAKVLAPEDYAEPRCLLCGEAYGVTEEIRPVPQQRIREKLDEYMSRRDFDGAERHLLYWLEEAVLGADLRGQLMIRGELIGFYRKRGEKEKAMESIEDAVRLINELSFEGTLSAGTTYVNIATACNAFGENRRAMDYFEKARAVYEANPAAGPELTGGLYNNMGICCCDLGEYENAEKFFQLALERMRTVPGGETEQAITWLNMADLAAAKLGMEEAETQIDACLEKALELLNTPGLTLDGYYAFVCEKCASVFSYYGYFLDAEELNTRAEEIYRTISDN